MAARRAQHRASRRRGGGRLVAAASAACVVSGLGVVGLAVAEPDERPVEPPLTRPAAVSASADPLPAGPGPTVPGPSGAQPSSAPTGTATPSSAQPSRVPKSAVIPDDVTATATIPGVTPLTSTHAPTATASPAPTPVQVAEPVRLRIPSIGVDSTLLHLGLEPDGSLEAPPRGGPDNDKAAWYDGSPRPGEPGPAVLEGHIDSQQGPSVFYRLGELAAGDTVLVDRADGSTATFVVDKAERYPKDDFPTRTVYGDTEDPQVRLITCGGEFDDSTGHYVDNTVVYGHLVG